MSGTAAVTAATTATGTSGNTNGVDGDDMAVVDETEEQPSWTDFSPSSPSARHHHHLNDTQLFWQEAAAEASRCSDQAPLDPLLANDDDREASEARERMNNAIADRSIGLGPITKVSAPSLSFGQHPGLVERLRAE